MRKHTTNHILLVKPSKFFKNPETSVNNYFQTDTGLAHLFKSEEEMTDDALAALASNEFCDYVEMLNQNGITTTVWDSQLDNAPDAIFPNNWFIAGADGTINLMPMFAKNRRIERDESLIQHLKYKLGYKKIKDFTRRAS